ncbi:MAG: glycogen debranching enzyme N-terminal domain-containing protein, partial [Planctomycetota bacterium]
MKALMHTDLPYANRRQGKVRDVYDVTLDGRDATIVHELGVLRMRLSRGEWRPADEWCRDQHYIRETERGYPDHEDLYTPCVAEAPCFLSGDPGATPESLTIAIAFNDEPDLT